MRNICVVYDSGNNAMEMAARLLCDVFRKEGSNASAYDAVTVDPGVFHDVDTLVFGSRCSFGTVSADFKSFMESTEDFWYQQPWRNKFAAGFTLSSCNSMYKLNTLQVLEQFAAYHGMHWIGLGVLPRFVCGQQSEGQNRFSCHAGLAIQYTDMGSSVEFHPGDLLTLELFAMRILEIKN